MKKHLLTILSLCICWTVQAQNLLQNGGFENDFTRWNNISENGASATFTVETASANVQEGTKALKVEVDNTGTNAWDVQSIHGGWTAEPGKAYTLTFYAKAAADGAKLTTVQQKSPFYAQKEFTLTDEWQRYEWTFVPTEAEVQLKVYFRSVGTLFLDNFNLMLVPDPADNLLQNGGFENDFVWWNNISENGANGTFSIERSIVSEGSKAMKVEVTTPGANPWNIQSLHNGWTADMDKTYTLSFYARAAAAGGKITVVQQNTTYDQKEFDLTTEWQRYEWTFLPKEESLRMKIYFPVAGIYYLDNFVIPVAGTVTSSKDDVLAASAVNVYPNPALGGKFSLEVAGASLANASKVQVVNAQGALVLEKDLHQSSVSFDKALSSGVYFVKVLHQGKVSVKRVVVL